MSKELDRQIAAAEKEYAAKKQDPEYPYIIWGMGNITESGYHYSVHIPQRYGRPNRFDSPTFDILNPKAGVDWMLEHKTKWMIKPEEVRDLGQQLIDMAGKFLDNANVDSKE